MVKANETNLEGILEGKRQYQVPLYQRVYSWGPKQIDQLWDDLIEIAEARRAGGTPSHFIGSLVLAASPDNGVVGVHKFLVVDGQQRLTTLSILLAAIRDHLSESDGQEHRDRIDAQYLVNKYEAGKPPKLVPTQADRSAYLAIVRASAEAGGEDAVGAAYRRFRVKLAEIDDPEDPHDIAAIENAVLRGLALVAVTAEAGDNAHRIFESLNNTGLRLTQSDLLKNHLFMRLGDRAEEVYEALWRPLEDKLGAENLELLFWLDLVQNDEKAKQSDTYLGQQRRFDTLTTPAEVEAEIRRIAKLGDVLATILKPEREQSQALRKRLERIRAWGSTTAYPIVMQVLAQRAAGRASDEKAIAALLCLESYFVRRIVIGRATAGLNRTLLQAVGAITEASDVEAALRDYLSEGRKHFATDAQVREAVTTVPFYWQGRASQKKLILLWLEESLRPKEPVDAKQLTIEHVLPQTLTDAVRAEFAASLPAEAEVALEHELLVHTLGNLTLSGYNSELSNRPFSQKRTMLAESGVRMNQTIAEHPTWGASEITERGQALAERIIGLWPGPNENLVGARDRESELRLDVATVLAGIPSGRWTTYGEVAVVVGSHPVPVGQTIANHAMPNPWRVLNAGGTVSAQFRWTDQHRTDDPRDLLSAEGVDFDDSGRADPEQFMDAVELAAGMGLDIDASTLRRRRRRQARKATTDPGALGVQQAAFWESVQQSGRQRATHASFHRTPGRRHWYPVHPAGFTPGVNLIVNTSKKRVYVEAYIEGGKEQFHALHAQRQEIERDLGYPVEWREQPEKKASRIIRERPGDFRDPAQADQLVQWLVRTADDFVRVLQRLGG